MVDRDRDVVTPDDVAAWLRREAQGDELAADIAFQRLGSAVPRVEALPAFSQRAAAAAWRSRQRQRLREVVARAAMLVLCISGAAGTWMALIDAGPWLLASGAAMASGLLVGLVAGAVAGLEWWATGARLGAVVGEVLSYREIAGTLLAIELLGAVALYAIHQLARRARVNTTS